MSARTHFQDACASLWLIGELVSLEDLVLHDARMDIHAPTHALTRAQTVLRARRRIAGAAPEWALSPDGLKALRGDGETALTTRVGQGEDDDAPGSPGDAGPLAGELAAIDRALDRSTKILAVGATRAALLRNPLIYDPDAEEAERLEAWRRAAAEVQPEFAASGGGPPVGRLGKRPAARAPDLARPSFGRGNAAGAAKNAVASGVGEFCIALRPARKTPLAGPGGKACRVFGSNRGGGGGRDEGSRPLAARAEAVGGQADRPPLQLPFARPGGIYSGAADRLGRHDRRRARRDPARRANHGRRAWPPRDDRARPLSRLGDLVTGDLYDLLGRKAQGNGNAR